MEKQNKVSTIEELMAAFHQMNVEWNERFKKSQEEFEKNRVEWWASFKKSQEEAAKRAAERDAEAAKRAAERDAEAAKRAAERDAEAAKRQADFDEKMEKLREEVSGISDNNGFFAEDFFQHVFSQKCELAGIKFDGMIPNLKYEGKESCEFDIVLVNGDSVAIIEAKYRIHPSYVKVLVTKKLAQFRKYFPTYKNHAVYFGIAGLSFSEQVVNDAKEYGVAIIRQDGQRVVLDSLPTKTY